MAESRMDMKKGIVFTALFRIMGILVLVFGVRMIGEGVYNYIDEHFQKDWPVITAYVTDSSGEYTSSRHSKQMVYDITYQYQVDGHEYSGMLYNRSQPMGPGETVTIKYDPDVPEHSTDILAPSFKNLVVFLVFGVLLTITGFFLSGLWALTVKIRRRGKPEEEEILPPEEYVDFEPGGRRD